MHNPRMPESRVFTKYREKWLDGIQQVQILTDALKAPCYSDAYILPLRRRTDAKTQNGCYEGGACLADGTFLGGLARSNDARNVNYSCKIGYVPPEQVHVRDETVVFGGVLIPHFGHTMVDCLSRMWWYAKNRDAGHKIVFVRITGTKKVYDCFFSAAGLSSDDWEIIDEPTRFSQVIVPEEAVFSISPHAHPDWLLYFDLIKSRVREKYQPPAEKLLYLSRRHLSESEGVNEEFYEDFYARRGYMVLAPETLPFEEQVNYIMNADKIVCTMGTLSHYAVFAKPGVNLTVLLRVPDERVFPQLIIDEIRHLDWYLIEATKNLLPSVHSRSFSLFAPTVHFRNYLDSIGEPYTEEELNYGQVSDEIFLRYMKDYAAAYSDPRRFRLIAKKSMFDVVSAMNAAFYDKELDPGEFAKASSNGMAAQLQKELDEIHSSRAWKLIQRIRKMRVVRFFKKAERWWKRLWKK